MKKYLEIAKLLFKAQLAWRASIAFNMLFTVLKILFAVVVWGAVYAENAVIGGFTLQGMLTYYVISSFFSQLDLSGEVAGEVSARIRNGTFSRYMVIPARVEGYFHAQNYGAAALSMLFNLAAAAAWTLLFGIEFTITRSPGLIAGALALEALGLIFMVQLNFLLGILTFRFGDISLFLMIKSNLLSILTGTMIPLNLFPELLLRLLRLTPFYAVTYLPTMLLLGRNAEELPRSLGVLGLWMLAFAGINHLAYEGLRRRYDGVGI